MSKGCKALKPQLGMNFPLPVPKTSKTKTGLLPGH
jgi:hypothetical protein